VYSTRDATSENVVKEVIELQKYTVEQAKYKRLQIETTLDNPLERILLFYSSRFCPVFERDKDSYMTRSKVAPSCLPRDRPRRSHL